MMTKTMTALAIVAGLTAVVADAKPTAKQNSSEKSATRQLNQQQLASVESGTTGQPGMAQGNMAPAPTAAPAADMNGPADPAATGGMADPANAPPAAPDAPAPDAPAPMPPQ